MACVAPGQARQAKSFEVEVIAIFDWNSSAAADKVGWLGLRLQSQSNRLRIFEEYYRGQNPTAFVAPEIREQLQRRVASLNANYCKLLTDALVQRIKLTGFALDGAEQPSPDLWRVWRRNHMLTEADWLLRDVMALGRGHVLCWTDAAGNPTLSVESPFQVISYRDPVTREIRGALKQWSIFDDVVNTQHSWSVLYLPDVVLTYQSQSPAAVNSIPAQGWKLINRQPNPLGVCPMVEFRNAVSVLDFHGTSEYEPIIGLQDALSKTLLDAMVSSEAGAFARRWATGLTVPEDDDGNPINPFGQKATDVWTSEDAETKFGQFNAQGLSNYDQLANLLTRHISAISGLPEYLTGSGSSNPVSADAIVNSELSLTARAEQKIDALTPAFAQVGTLIEAIRTGRAVSQIECEPLFADPQNHSESLRVDAFSKLVAAGIPIEIAAVKALGWTEQDAAKLKGLANDRSTAAAA